MLPNFRDHGMSVEGPLLRVIASNQRKHGECWASEAGLRTMVAEDVGHMPGVGTIPEAIRRFELQGLVFYEWLLPGGIMPDGKPAVHGTRLLRLSVNRRERLAYRARARDRDRREGVQRRVQRGMLATLAQARKNIAGVVPEPEPPELANERERQRQNAAIAEWYAQGEQDELAREKPPD